MLTKKNLKEKIKGFVSARHIIGGSFIPVDLDEYLDRLFLSFDLFVWRCKQYKKYSYHGIILFVKKYEKYFNLYKKNYSIFGNKNYIPFNMWLFDFVMNGKMDEEMKK